MKRNNELRIEDVTYEIKEHFGVLGENSDGWTLEANAVSWNGGPVKLDLREWAPDHKRLTRGVTIDFAYAEPLANALARSSFLKGLTPKEPVAIVPGFEEADFVKIYEIAGEVSKWSSGWKKLVTASSWADEPIKVDIRDWSDDLEKMARGVKLPREQAKVLLDVLNSSNVASYVGKS